MSEVPYTLLDIRGMMLAALLVGDDPDGPLNDAGKTDNSAEYGFNNFIERTLPPLLEMSAPRRIIAVWDGGNGYRKGLFPDYKKKRGEREISPYAQEQMDRMQTLTKSALAALGCTQCLLKGVEADDVLAYLCQKLPGNKVVYTGDQDLIQLDNEHTDVVYRDGMVKLSDTMPDPKTIAITKSLLGDTSDEYPGVKGFGPAKLDAIVNEFGVDVLADLEECVRTRQFDDVQGAMDAAKDPVAKKGLSLIMADTQSWVLMYTLAQLHPELCTEVRDKKFPIIEWTKRVPNLHTFKAVLEDGQCPELASRFDQYMPVYELVTADNWDQFVDHFMAELPRTPFFAFDYESYDVLKHPDFNEAKRSKGDYVDVLSQSITGMSICYGEHLQYVSYISVDHADTNNVPDEYLKDILETVLDGDKELVAHNAPFEIALTDTNFEYPLGQIIDTRIMAHYVDENDSNHLKDLTKQYLKYQQTTYTDTLAEAGVDNMQQMTGAQVLNYGCDDSIVTAQLCDLFYIILCLEGTIDFCLDEETGTNALLYEAFESGIRIDYERLDVMAKEDATTFECNMATLRGLLLTYCRSVEEKNADELYNELSEFTAAKMRLDGDDEVKIERKLETMRTSLVASTQYEPLIEVDNEVKFTPTALQITRLAQGEFKLQSELIGVTPAKVTEFLSNVDIEKAEAGLPEDESRDDFLNALAECSTELKKRSGETFDTFLAICVDIKSKGAGTSTTGDQLNLDSPIQMQQLLYCKMGLPIRLYSKLQHNSTRDKLGYYHGGPSTDDKAIDTALAEDCQPDPAYPAGDWRRDALLALKEAKAANTRRKNYWRPYPLWKHPRDGLLHGGITNCGTVTKRFTGSNPNELQLSSKDGGRVRSMVLAREDNHVILSPDFNGEELRITGSLSLDPVMIDAYNGEVPKDLHSITAAAISGAVLYRENPALLEQIDMETVNGMMQMPYDVFLGWLDSSDKDTATLFKNIRKLAKGVNFLLLYVGGAGTLARNLGVPTEVAEQFLAAAMNTFPRLGPWQQESILFAQEHGYVLTSYGNRRHLGPGLFSDDNGVRTRLERQAVNSQVQGTGSDLMKVVMAEMFTCNTLKTYNANLMVAPYDEVAVSVPRAAAWGMWLEMQSIMTITPPGHVISQLPELKAGAHNWGNLEELGAFPTEDAFNEMLDKQISKRAAA
jgi:DNA polymerase I-like protein with 3'-5' exonuclease and polymerase domains/5'-3' exonuclease